MRQAYGSQAELTHRAGADGTKIDLKTPRSWMLIGNALSAKSSTLYVAKRLFDAANSDTKVRRHYRLDRLTGAKALSVATLHAGSVVTSKSGMAALSADALREGHARQGDISGFRSGNCGSRGRGH